MDAWVNYETIVEADTPEEAAQIASEQEGDLKWTGGEIGDVQEYDHREFYTLDDDGMSIESTKVESR